MEVKKAKVKCDVEICNNLSTVTVHKEKHLCKECYNKECDVELEKKKEYWRKRKEEGWCDEPLSWG